MMTTDDRDLLAMLQEELDFIEKGGYGRSVSTPWLPKSVFQDSLSCLNYGYPYRAHPCTECHLLNFVPAEDRNQTVPCHHIKLDEAGTTIEHLDACDNQKKTEEALKKWLRARIDELQMAQAS
jgi:hypothetical protein